MLYLIVVMLGKVFAKKNLPLGISLLRVFYAINAFLLFFTSLLFFDYLDIVIFGKIMPPAPAVVIRLLLVAIPLYLIISFSALKKESYPLALAYHSFFLINAVTLMIYSLNKNLKIKPLLEILTKSEYKTTRIEDFFGIPLHIYIIQSLSIVIGLAILVYLYKKRSFFKN